MAVVTQEQLDTICKQLADKGLLVEAGWVWLRMSTIPAEAPELQIEEMRNAFFAGAQHMFSSLMAMLEEGTEPTQADMDRLDAVNAELNNFLRLYKAKYFTKESRA